MTRLTKPSHGLLCSIIQHQRNSLGQSLTFSLCDIAASSVAPPPDLTLHLLGREGQLHAGNVFSKTPFVPGVGANHYGKMQILLLI